jgi:hypothetical protein
MVGDIVVDDKRNVLDIVFGLLLLSNLFQSVDGQTIDFFIVPCIGDAVDLR